MARKNRVKNVLTDEQKQELSLVMLESLNASELQVDEVLNSPKLWAIWQHYLRRKDFVFNFVCLGVSLMIEFSKVKKNSVPTNNEPQPVTDKGDSFKRYRGKGKKPIMPVVSFSLESEYKDVVEKYAQIDDRSFSSMLRIIIKQWAVDKT